jgi:hypothetical protein
MALIFGERPPPPVLHQEFKEKVRGRADDNDRKYQLAERVHEQEIAWQLSNNWGHQIFYVPQSQRDSYRAQAVDQAEPNRDEPGRRANNLKPRNRTRLGLIGQCA